MQQFKEIEQVDIQDYLTSQIDDFELELFVHRSVKDQGMSSSHGGSYLDPLTGKSRQFDVQAFMYAPPNRGIFLAIECKALTKTFPLIVSRVARSDDEAYHELLRTWGRRESGEDFQTCVRSNERMPLYPAGQPVGKKTVQLSRDVNAQGKSPFKTADGETFEKWSQAIASSHDALAKSRTLRGENGSGDFYSAVLPVLVVSDETLWVVDYSDTGYEVPRSVDHTTLFVERRYAIPGRAETFTLSHLHIYTRSGFTLFLADLHLPHSAGIQERLFRFVVR